MATINYGLSAKGFKRKRLPEIIQSLNRTFVGDASNNDTR